MKIRQISELLHATACCGEDLFDEEVYTACGSDMMSDVLAFVKDQAVLLTGLVNAQVIRTAMMMDMRCVVFVRGKRPTQEMIQLADENRIVLLCSGERMYEACGKLYEGMLGREG